MPQSFLKSIRYRKKRSLKPAERESKKANTTFASGPVLAQQSIGNRAVQRILQAKLLQAKLTVNPPDDEYEKEADQVADTVMRKSDPQVGMPPSDPEKDDKEKRLQTKPLSGYDTLIQRDEIPEDEKKKKEDEEKKIETKSLSGQSTSIIQRETEKSVEEEKKKKEEEEKRIQTKKLSEDADIQAHVKMPGAGQPLAPDLRHEMEIVLDADLSQVRVHDNASDRADADRLNAKAFTNENNIWIGSAGSAEDRKLMAHELTHVVQQNASGSSAEPIIRRDENPGLSNLQKLDELLDRWNVPEEEVIDLLGRLSPAEKASVLSKGYKDKIAKALNVGEMVRAVDNLGPSLSIKLDWVKSATRWVRVGINYADIKNMITKAPPVEKNALKTGWRDFFVEVCTSATMAQAVDDLGFDLATKLEWMRAETIWTRFGLSYSDIKAKVISAPPVEKNALKTSTWRDFFVEVCTSATMAQAVDDLGFDLATKLEWMRAETIWVKAGLSYSDIKAKVISAPPVEKNALKIPAWRDFFVAVCTNETMDQAVQDLSFDYPTRFDWLMAEGAISQALRMLNSLADSDFNAVMAAMTQAQTSEFLKDISASDRVTYSTLIDRIKAARVLETAKSMEGQLRWRGGSGPDPSSGYRVSETTNWGLQNDFAKWIRGTGPEPTNTSTMNCWEAILFMAYKAGIVNKSRLVNIHNDAANSGDSAASAASAAGLPASAVENAGLNAYYSKLESLLYSGSRTNFSYNPTTGVGSPDIPAGNIIFVNSLSHVMFSRGTKDPNGKHEVISHWIFPSPGSPVSGTTIGFIQRTTLEDVLVTGSLTTATVEFAKPPW